MFRNRRSSIISSQPASRLRPYCNSVICGDAARILSTLPEAIADAVVTSPPYFDQRDYSHPDQIGNESSPGTYIEKLVAVFRECRRVLSDRGTLWINLGDKYRNGQLLGIPWRLALALQDDGWLLRSD